MNKMTNNTSKKINILFDLQDYMFTSKNIDRYSKHIINFNNKTIDEIIMPKSSLKNIKQIIDKQNSETKVEFIIKDKNKNDDGCKSIKTNKYERKKETIYKPKQKDSLFWCFYILKNGFFNYEMEINNQYFVVEKNEKFKYIELLRKNKNILKIHKIKPLTQLEDELANRDKISPKTFFALCALENINILLVDKRKVYELLCVDIDTLHPINIVHRDNKNDEHWIELDVTKEIISKYKETYYNLTSFDTTLKSISSYKLEELIDLCKKLNIDIEEYKNKKILAKQKVTKKDIYELLVLNY
jgi:hypothetical protein